MDMLIVVVIHLGGILAKGCGSLGAQQQLATLEDICLIPCVETDDLKRGPTSFRQTSELIALNWAWRKVVAWP
jgi:hypothetical protein